MATPGVSFSHLYPLWSILIWLCSPLVQTTTVVPHGLPFPKKKPFDLSFRFHSRNPVWVTTSSLVTQWTEHHAPTKELCPFWVNIPRFSCFCGFTSTALSVWKTFLPILCHLLPKGSPGFTKGIWRTEKHCAWPSFMAVIGPCPVAWSSMAVSYSLSWAIASSKHCPVSLRAV